jgi:hypothetical protein
MNRTVRPGQVLVEVARLDQDWKIELQMPENRMGHVTRAQADFGDALPVQYILATEPDQRREAKIRSVHYQADVRGEEGSTVLIDLDVDARELTYKWPGAQVTAMVYCGRRPLGYWLLHDPIAFLHSQVLFRFFW